MRLQGRTAVVTGAARGIGLAVTERFVAEGARVALVDRDGQAVETAAKRLGAAALALVADVTRTDDVERVIAAAHERWGRLDVVVNNAGITGRSYPIWELTDEDWHQVLACDLTSVFLVCRAAVRRMLAQGGGRIVNIASIAGKEGNPTLVPYSAAKAGVIGLTKALAKEVATKGVLVNAVAPAVIGTELLQQMTKETVALLEKVNAKQDQTIARLSEPPPQIAPQESAADSGATAPTTSSSASRSSVAATRTVRSSSTSFSSRSSSTSTFKPFVRTDDGACTCQGWPMGHPKARERRPESCQPMSSGNANSCDTTCKAKGYSIGLYNSMGC